MTGKTIIIKNFKKGFRGEIIDNQTAITLKSAKARTFKSLSKKLRKGGLIPTYIAINKRKTTIY